MPVEYNPNRKRATGLPGDLRFSEGLEDVRKHKGWDQGFGIYGDAQHIGRDRRTYKVGSGSYNVGAASPSWWIGRGKRTYSQYVSNVETSHDYLVSGDINDLYMTFSARQDPDLALGTVGGVELLTHESRESLRRRNFEGDNSMQGFRTEEIGTIGRNQENYSKLIQSERARRKVFTNSFFQ